jgi:hypothetical protein
MSEVVVVVSLSVLNIVQLIFWGIHTHKLTNKLMSRNFAEYDLVRKGPPKEKEQIEFSEYEEELEEEEILTELNGMIRAKI